MPGKKTATGLHIECHRDGSVWARGRMKSGVMTGYWEWFRKNGTILRNGFFMDGRQAGDWTTYDNKGRVYKATRMPALSDLAKGSRRRKRTWIRYDDPRIFRIGWKLNRG